MLTSGGRTGQATYKMFLTNLREIMQRYFDAKNIDTMDKLADAFLMEAFCDSLNDSVKQFVFAREPKSAEDCAMYADLCFEVSRIGKDSVNANGSNYRPPQRRHAMQTQYSAGGHLTNHVPPLTGYPTAGNHQSMKHMPFNPGNSTGGRKQR